MANVSQLAALTVALEIRFVCPVNVVLKCKNVVTYAAHPGIAWMDYAVQQGKIW